MGLFDDAEPEADARPIRRVVQTDPTVITRPDKGPQGEPPSQAEYERALREHEDAQHPEDADASVLGDILSTVAPVIDLDDDRREGVRRRMTRRLERTTEDPITALLGAAEGGSWGGLDEFLGAISARPEVRAGVTGSRAGIATESRPAHTYREGQREARAEIDAAHEANPDAFETGEAGGTVLGMLAVPEIRAAEGASGLARVGTALAEGELVGGISGLLNSDAAIEENPMDLLADTGEGAMMGGATSGVIHGVGAGARGARDAMRRAAPEAREAADLARVASVAPGRTISRTDPTIAEWEAVPGGVAGGAERLRRLGITGRARSTRGVADAARAEVDRIGREVLGPIRERIAAAGPVRTADIVRSLDAYAAELEASPNASLRPLARMLRQQTRAMTSSWGEAVPYAEAERLLRELGEQTQWTSRAGTPVRPPTEVRQRLYRALRGDLDDVAESRTDAGTREAFRQGRYDQQAGIIARDQAEARLGRDAQSTSLVPGMQDATIAGALGSMGAGPTGQVAGAVARRALAGGRGASMRATGTELIAELLESGGRASLGPYGEILERALRRGGPALAATHYTLSQTDPEYRALMTGLEEGDGSEAVPSLWDDFETEDAAPPQ